MKKATLFAPSLAVIWNLIDAAGFCPEPLFRHVQIDPRLMRDPNARVPAVKQQQLLALAAENIADPCFGLKAASSWHPSNLGPLGYAWLTSSSLKTALGRLVRFGKIVNEEFSVSVSEGDPEVVVTVNNAEPGVGAVLQQADLAILAEMCRANLGAHFDPLKVEFPHPAPACKGDYFALFRCPVEFAASASRLTISRTDYERESRGDSPQLAQLHDRVMLDYLARLSDENLLERLKAAIIDQLPSGNISDASVAEAVYMTVRTMQRRLQEEGTSYRELLESVRQELARQYIRDSSLSISEISFLLGFSEVSGFSRAFKRWTGGAPSAARVSLP